jgi:hypothetical protein
MMFSCGCVEDLSVNVSTFNFCNSILRMNHTRSDTNLTSRMSSFDTQQQRFLGSNLVLWLTVSASNQKSSNDGHRR